MKDSAAFFRLHCITEEKWRLNPMRQYLESFVSIYCETRKVPLGSPNHKTLYKYLEDAYCKDITENSISMENLTDQIENRKDIIYAGFDRWKSFTEGNMGLAKVMDNNIALEALKCSLGIGNIESMNNLRNFYSDLAANFLATRRVLYRTGIL